MSEPNRENRLPVLIAEDDAISRRLLEATLGRLGYEVISTTNGREAWEVLDSDDAPQLAILDWMMPEMDGIDVCRRLRERRAASYVYVVLLTAKGQKSDVVAGLEAGADDYVTKPFDPHELSSRLDVGRRILSLESELAGKIDELQHALNHVKQLQGLLPICMYCKRIRDDEDAWHRLESYIERHSEAMFTHSLCGECMTEHYPEHAASLKKSRT